MNRLQIQRIHNFLENFFWTFAKMNFNLKKLQINNFKDQIFKIIDVLQILTIFLW